MKQYRDSRGWLYQVMPGLEGCAFKGEYQKGRASRFRRLCAKERMGRA